MKHWRAEEDPDRPGEWLVVAAAAEGLRGSLVVAGHLTREEAQLIAAAPALRAELDIALRTIEDAKPGAFRNGNTHPDWPDGPDEGEYLTARLVDRSWVLIARAGGEVPTGRPVPDDIPF